MVDIDPRLDSKLRVFFERIESSTPPPGLTDIDVESPGHGRRATFNLFAGLAAAAVIAAGIAVFAIELSSHDNPAPGPAAGSASPLKAMPQLGDGGVPTAAHVVISLTRGHGPLQLQTIVPQGTLYIQFNCLGPGSFEIASTNHVIDNVLEQCSTDTGVTTMTVQGPKAYDDKPLTLRVTADPAMRWEIYAAQSRALLPPFTIDPDSRVLVPLTYGTGLATLPAFLLAPGEDVYVQVACNSATAADTVQVGENQRFGSEIAGCSTPSGGHGGWFQENQGGPNGGSVTTYVTADAAVSWEILMTDGPPPILVPSAGARAVAPTAYGRGSGGVSAFTAATVYSIGVGCSGAGSLKIAASTSQVATIRCGGLSEFFTPSDQVRGQPVSLSVVASSTLGWEVEVFEGGGPAPGSCAAWLNDVLSPTPCAGPSP
ncbi:MAG: hypothetical protein WAL84_02005 [Candidatus Dormiibacterota bacterium]